MIYTVTFNPALDYVVHLPKLTLGEVNRTESDTLCFGGKGINVSAVLKELGVESVALGFTAGFTGKAMTAARPTRSVYRPVAKVRNLAGRRYPLPFR